MEVGDGKYFLGKTFFSNDTIPLTVTGMLRYDSTIVNAQMGTLILFYSLIKFSIQYYNSYIHDTRTYICRSGTSALHCIVI